jgi:hypothetical protein
VTSTEPVEDFSTTIKKTLEDQSVLGAESDGSTQPGAATIAILSARGRTLRQAVEFFPYPPGRRLLHIQNQHMSHSFRSWFTPYVFLTVRSTLTLLTQVPKKFQALRPSIRTSIIRSISLSLLTQGK